METRVKLRGKITSIFFLLSCFILANVLLTIAKSHSYKANGRSHLRRISDYVVFQFHVNLGAVAQIKDDTESTIKHYGLALKLEPSSTRIRSRLASILEAEAIMAIYNGNLVSAHDLFLYLADIDPYNARSIIFICAWNHFHDLPVKIDQLRKIESNNSWKLTSEIMEKVIIEGEFNPRVGNWIIEKSKIWTSLEWLYLVAGDIFWISGDFDSARQSYKKARQLDTGDPNILLRSGILERIIYKDIENGCRFLNASLDLNPESEYKAFIESNCPDIIINEKLRKHANVRNENEILISAFTDFYNFMAAEVDQWEKPLK